MHGRTRALKRAIAVLTTATALGALVPAPASAGGGVGLASRSIRVAQRFTLGGARWLVTVTGTDTDGSTDSVSVSFSRGYTRRRPNRALIHRLTEMQTFSFSSLADNTVVVNSNFTGTINLRDQLPGVFEGDIDIVRIPDTRVRSSCNGNIKTAPVRTTNASNIDLRTENTVFGRFRKVPDRGTATRSTGNCPFTPGRVPCPGASRSLNGFGFDNDGGSFSWGASAPNAGNYGTLSATSSRPFPSSTTLGTGPNGSYIAQIFGTVLKSRISVPENLSAGSADARNLPRLAGIGNATATAAQSASGYTNCGRDKRFRSLTRTGTQGGNLTFTPSGGQAASSGDDFSFESGSLSKVQVSKRP
jgi:hypothetical protein